MIEVQLNNIEQRLIELINEVRILTARVEYLENKAFSAAQLSSAEEGQGRSKRAVKILKHFDISPNAAGQLLKDYYSRPTVKAPYNPIERDRILGRAAKKKRLKERMKTE